MRGSSTNLKNAKKLNLSQTTVVLLFGSTKVIEEKMLRRFSKRSMAATVTVQL